MHRVLALTRGIFALAALVVLTVGVPWLLVATVGNPYPAEGLTLGGRLTDNALLGLLAVIAWVVWAQLVACVVIEVIAEIRLAVGRSADWMTRVPGTVSGQQRLVRVLVQAVVAGTIGAAAGSAVPMPAVVAVSTSPVDLPLSATVAPAVAASHPAKAVKPPKPLEVTVAKGDTLWSLAERHLGAGERWREIADLNVGRAMVGGQRFAHAESIEPGWRLLVPQDSAQVAQSASVVVERGDTLWELAEEELGAGERWPRLYRANSGRIEDPDLIYPGQVLAVPGQRAGTPPRPSAPPSESDGVRDRAVPEPDRGHPPLPGPPAPSPEQASPDRDGGAEHEVDAPEKEGSGIAALLAGGGALLGGSLLSLFLLRRRMQYRVRRSGRIVSITPPELVATESAIRGAEADGHDDAEFLDKALRELVAVIRDRDGITTLPDVVAVRLTNDHLELHLRAPYGTRVPAPWSEDASALVLTRRRDLHVEEAGTFAPYPTLVTVGSDEAGDLWLVDLEAAGIVHLQGEREDAEAVARFLVTELGVNLWSDHVGVNVGEFASLLSVLSPDRICRATEQPAAELVESVRSVVDSTHVTGQDVLTGRLDGGAAEAWMPQVTLVEGGEVDREALPTLLAELEQPTGRKAVALVVVDGETAIEEATLRLTVDHDGWMSIEPLGVKVRANRVNATDAEKVAAFMAHHRRGHDSPMPDPVGDRLYEELSDAAGSIRETQTSPRDPAGAADSLLPLPDEAYVAAAATTPEDLAALAPRVPQQVSEWILALDPTLDDDVAAWHDSANRRPRIRLLGPVELLVEEDADNEKRTRRATVTEIVAYLVTRPQGATSGQIAADFGLSENAVYNYLSATRQWLSDDPTLLPECTKSEAARRRGVGIYQLGGMLSDEDLFRRLRVRAHARGAEGIDDLVTALGLVEGRPFDQIRPRGYRWLAETPLDHELTAAIVDVAHIVATHCLAVGDAETARWAAEKAILAAPAEDKPRLDLAAALTAAGDGAPGKRVLDLLEDDSREEAQSGDPSRRTAAIAGQIERRRDALAQE